MKAVGEMTWDELKALVRSLPPMTPEQRREQRICFVLGNLHLSNIPVTREMVERAVDKADADEFDRELAADWGLK
jgi:hypothetical protein